MQIQLGKPIPLVFIQSSSTGFRTVGPSFAVTLPGQTDWGGQYGVVYGEWCHASKIKLKVSQLQSRKCARRKRVGCLQCFETVGRQEGHPACKKTEWPGAGVVICLERCADLHMAQLMPVSLTVSCFIKIQISFTSLVPAHPGSPGQKAVKRV